jgi:prepilin-type N-terminal cleavage/methylation domain-containing protein
MSRPSPFRRQAGFTLIEVMLVTAIIGILASVAIPNYQRVLLRTKTAERVTVMNRIKQQVQDFYLRKGASIDPVAHVGVSTIVSGYNPEWPPTAQKRPTDSTVAGKPVWAEYFSATATNGSVKQEVEGALYYSYYFQVDELPSTPRIHVWAYGDLDGDGLTSSKYMRWTRQNGVYVHNASDVNDESPLPGDEDLTTF